MVWLNKLRHRTLNFTAGLLFDWIRDSTRQGNMLLFVCSKATVSLQVKLEASCKVKLLPTVSALWPLLSMQSLQSHILSNLIRVQSPVKEKNPVKCNIAQKNCCFAITDSVASCIVHTKCDTLTVLPFDDYYDTT